MYEPVVRGVSDIETNPLAPRLSDGLPVAVRSWSVAAQTRTRGGRMARPPHRGAFCASTSVYV